jgi:hypothetical protein
MLVVGSLLAAIVLFETLYFSLCGEFLAGWFEGLMRLDA